ncbi:MAG: ABC transporter transmembrane domain-containing protein, partial [Gemmatimonadales bacterium]
MDTFRRLLGRLDAYWAAFLASLVAATIASVFDGLSLVLLLPFLRLLFEGDATGTGLATILGLILGAMVIKNVAHYAAVSVGVTVQERVVRDLRVDTYHALQAQSLGFFQRHKAGDLLTRLVADTEQVRTAVSLALASTVRNGVLVLVYLVILFVLSWRLALVTLVLAPALAIGLRPLFRRIRVRAQTQVAARGELGAVAADALSGARVIKTQLAEAQEADRFARAAGAAAESAVRFQRVAFLASPLGEVLGTGVIMALL